MKRSSKSNNRGFGAINGRSRAGQAGVRAAAARRLGPMMGSLAEDPAAVAGSQVFVGPSVEGADVEFIEIVRGQVSERKPSFAR
ncbi:hypothetical protein HGI30_04535 [Paenibacillus albicereus]|uniref:Uncharacterized protein n=1 Tax=Paenibacillus albicereus TaxID=2726185 RepID=A0A6H2GU22_9BACL|nr:hypothetical protein [Paenibacillus albicereus]QJC50897.1 hypothetical protein HGI30_04535 [Paenibacillus albicereus]